MVLSIPNELENFITRCQKAVNNRFWLYDTFEFRYAIVNPLDDTSELKILIAANFKYIAISYMVSIVCCSADACYNSFLNELDKFERYANSEEENNG